MTTRVVSIRGGKKIGVDYDVYVGAAGRGTPRGCCGLRLDATDGGLVDVPVGHFANPFKRDADWFTKYLDHVEKRIETEEGFEEAIIALKGKRLGCWCRPPEGFQGRVMCHAQILAALADGIKPDEVE